MKRYVIYGLALICILFAGCEKADVYTSNPRANFEALWTIIDERYCFFDYKEIDWDEVHKRYSAKVSDSMDEQALFDLLANMLAELKDGHTNLISSFNLSRYAAWHEDFPPNFYEDIQQKYMGSDFRIADGLTYKHMVSGELGYIFYDSFVGGVGESSLDDLFLYFKDCKGLIIDIRNNGGGSLTNSDRIASRFLDHKMLVGYMQHKTGPGHSDFSDPYPLYLDPSDRIRWMRPVIVLTNRLCFSAANDFVQKMRMFPQVTILGDRTGGGSGFPFSAELPNGWAVRFSAGPMLDADKQSTEFGIEPDVKVSMNSNDIMRGRDTLIEEAIKRLMND